MESIGYFFSGTAFGVFFALLVLMIAAALISAVVAGHLKISKGDKMENVNAMGQTLDSPEDTASLTPPPAKPIVDSTLGDVMSAIRQQIEVAEAFATQIAGFQTPHPTKFTDACGELAKALAAVKAMAANLPEPAPMDIGPDEDLPVVAPVEI